MKTARSISNARELILALAILAIGNIVSFSATIPLYNTGVNNSGGLLGNATIDPHYTLISAPSPYTSAFTGNGTDTLGSNPYLDDGPNSRWINPSGWMGEWLPAGNYLYRTTFNLTGFVPSSASLSLKIASDNSCKVFFNGADTGIATTTNGFTSFAAFSINSGFLSGLNTLDFLLNNAVDLSVGNFNPTGLRVELDGTANVVPEPGALALMSLGVIIISMRKSVR